MAKRLLTNTSIAIASVLACQAAWALGFGPVRATAYLGYPLDLSVPLQLQPGESVNESCVSAAVSSGDSPLPPSAVSVSLVQSPGGVDPRVRVRTTGRIDEPFVTVTVTLGCEARLSRQFTVFADPPPTAPVLEPSTRAAAPTAVSEVRAEAPAAAAPSGGIVAPPPNSRRASSGGVRREAAASAPAQRPVAAVNRSRAAAVPEVAPAPPAEKAPLAEAARSSSGTVVKAESVARLRLDAPVVTMASDQAYAEVLKQREQEALKTAKIAVDVAQAANNSAAQRVAAMEASVQALRKENAEQRAAMERLRGQIGDSGLADGLMPWLAGACIALAGLAGFFFVRMRRLDAVRAQTWLDVRGPLTRQSEFDTVGVGGDSGFVSPQAQAAEPAPAAVTVAAVPEVPVPEVPVPSARPAQAASSRFAETQPSSAYELDQGAQGHDISIEELLDVEQQAEFFIVLGQDDAAIDLLTSHVMASGGASPMPYLKLLEIYRRIGDQTSYERTRKRFNARFNGVAPEWTADPNTGRSLDEYPEVMHRIERVWVRPVDAMADLQTLMFRNDSNLLFELPAYRDIMLLFTLARDLHDASSEDATAVDVLLPLGDHGDLSDAFGGTPMLPVGTIEDGLDPDGLSLAYEETSTGTGARVGGGNSRH